MMKASIAGACLLLCNLALAQQPSNEAMKQSFLAAVAACKAALSTAPTRRVHQTAAGECGASAVTAAEVVGADAFMTTSIVAPWAGWIRVRTITAVMPKLASEEAARAADPAGGAQGTHEGTYTLRLNSSDGHWTVGAAEAAVKLTGEGIRPQPAITYRQAPADLMRGETPQAACAQAVEATGRR